ncbi:MAG: BlaI/MecI/CopY family transcriptional regulator [Clostridia bacterium]|nr:BlaI/MecI/CopY family transcriptional regulator [Clostridia bacterium]
MRCLMKFFDSELKVMETLWTHGDLTAKAISELLKDEIGWNINTTYTVIKKCIKKGAIERSEPHFLCHALVSKEEAQKTETEELIGRLYDGSVEKLFAALLGSCRLSAAEIERLKEMVSEQERKQ